MPYSKAEFDEAKQHKFKAAVSSAAGAPAENVVLVAIAERKRRLGSVDVGKTLDVETKVLVYAQPQVLHSPLPATV